MSKKRGGFERMSPEKDEVLCDLRLGRRGRGILSERDSSRCGQSCSVPHRASQTCHRYRQLETVDITHHSIVSFIWSQVQVPGWWSLWYPSVLPPSQKEALSPTGIWESTCDFNQQLIPAGRNQSKKAQTSSSNIVHIDMLRKSIPGWSSSATQDPECPAQMRSAVVLVTASSGPNKKQRHPDLSSCNGANLSLHCPATSYSR